MGTLSEFLKLASNETRFRIMFLIYQKELCVCELRGILEESQPIISKHLTKLRDTHFANTIQKGKFIFYKLNINDSAAIELLETIRKNLDKYPELKEDYGKLAICKELSKKYCACRND